MGVARIVIALRKLGVIIQQDVTTLNAGVTPRTPKMKYLATAVFVARSTINAQELGTIKRE